MGHDEVADDEGAVDLLRLREWGLGVIGIKESAGDATGPIARGARDKTRLAVALAWRRPLGDRGGGLANGAPQPATETRVG